MSDVIEKLVDYSPTGLLLNAVGGDAGGGFAKMTGLKKDEAGGAVAPGTTNPTITGENSIEAQSAARRLARLSRYFTTPTGIMDSGTGSTGVF
jgi:hypothetical protein